MLTALAAPYSRFWVERLATSSHPVRFVHPPQRRQQVSERREHLRFDKVFTVYLTTSEGMTRGIGRNICARGMFVETREPLGLGESLKVTFAGEDGTEMTCLAEVRYQVALSYGIKGGLE